MIQCQHCPKEFANELTLLTHLVEAHGYVPEQAKATSRGWFEAGQPMGGDVIKAPEHVAAATRAQIRRDQPMTQPMKMSVPVVPVEKKRTLTLPPGWVKAGDSYVFEQTLSEEHTVDNIILKKVKGRVTSNHGVLELYTYTKDVTDLAELQEKERILNSRLDGLCVSDGSYLEIVRSLHELTPKIKAMRRDMRPEIDSETVLEDYFRGTQGRDGQIEWQESFMKRCLEETAQTKKNVTKTDPIPIEKHKIEQENNI